jgi:hypothetical protein
MLAWGAWQRFAFFVGRRCWTLTIANSSQVFRPQKILQGPVPERLQQRYLIKFTHTMEKTHDYLMII